MRTGRKRKKIAGEKTSKYMEEKKLKEFYFREKNGEVFFFFREKKKNSISYELWKENCDNVEMKENDTLEKLLSFLRMNNGNRTEAKIDDITVTVWKNSGYRFAIIYTGNMEGISIGNRKIYKLDVLEEK